MQEQTELTKQLSEKEIVDMMVTLSAEYVTVIEKIETAKSDQKRDIIRDLSNTGLALLGGVLTLVTVSPELIQTPYAVYLGTGIVILSVVGAFYSRIKISRRFTRIIDKQYNDYTTRANTARGIIASPNTQHASFELDKVIKDLPFSSELFGKYLLLSEIIVGVLLFVGSLITAAGLIFKITIS